MEMDLLTRIVVEETERKLVLARAERIARLERRTGSSARGRERPGWGGRLIARLLDRGGGPRARRGTRAAPIEPRRAGGSFD